jgi:hypothetical protein
MWKKLILARLLKDKKVTFTVDAFPTKFSRAL